MCVTCRCAVVERGNSPCTMRAPRCFPSRHSELVKTLLDSIRYSIDRRGENRRILQSAKLIHLW